MSRGGCTTCTQSWFFLVTKPVTSTSKRNTICIMLHRHNCFPARLTPPRGGTGAGAHARFSHDTWFLQPVAVLQRSCLWASSIDFYLAFLQRLGNCSSYNGYAIIQVRFSTLPSAACVEKTYCKLGPARLIHVKCSVAHRFTLAQPSGNQATLQVVNLAAF